jgi:hypothetical protein
MGNWEGVLWLLLGCRHLIWCTRGSTPHPPCAAARRSSAPTSASHLPLRTRLLLTPPLHTCPCRREFEKALATGDGSFDPEYMLTKLPEALQIDKRRVGWTVKELVGSRKRMLLVQAVSQYR